MSFIYRYLRHSDDIEEQPNSRQAQVNQIDAWIAQEQLPHVDAGEFWDADCSGGIDISKRPAGGVMMGRVRRGDVIVSAKWDRMFRDSRDFENTLYTLDKLGVRLVCLNMNVDTSTSAGKLAARLLVAMGEFERTECSDRTKKGLAVIKYNRGVKVAPARPPLGWKHSRKHTEKRKDGKPYAILVPDQDFRDECKLIARLHEVNHLSMNHIAKLFLRNGRKNTVTGKVKWDNRHIDKRYKAFKAGFPAKGYEDGVVREQLMIAVQQ